MLLVGGKGGYINSLIAQIVGINGEVVTVSANKEILLVCQERVGNSPFDDTMKWKVVSSVQDPNIILGEFKGVIIKELTNPLYLI